MSTERESAIPKAISISAGLAAGGAVGLSAGEAVAGWLDDQVHGYVNHLELSGILDPVTSRRMIELVDHGLEVTGLLGGCAVGCIIAAEKPAEAVFLAGATIATQLGKPPAEPHYHTNQHTVELSDSPPGAENVNSFSLTPDDGVVEAAHHVL